VPNSLENAYKKQQIRIIKIPTSSMLQEANASIITLERNAFARIEKLISATQLRD